jgi:tetratricopeptide (TPR) repeat protein
MEQEFYYKQGLDQARAGNYHGAVHSFSSALRVNSQFADAYYKRGMALFDLGDQQGAIADYSSAIAIQPNFIAAYFGRSLVRLSIGDYQAAIADAESAIRLDPNYVSAVRILGKVYQQLNQIPLAVSYYEQAALLYLQQQDEANCRRCLESVKQLKALLPPTAEDFYAQAVQKVRAGNYVGALADWNWVIQNDTKNAKAYCMRGLVLCRLGNQREAMQDLNLAIQIDPDDVEVRMSRAVIRAEIGDSQGAVDDFTQLLRDRPQWTEAYVGRGLALCKLGNYRNAIEDYSRAVSLKPDDAQMYSDRAIAREKFGDLQGAINDYQQAVNIWLNQNNLLSYQQGLDKIQNLRSSLQNLQAQQKREADRAFQSTQAIESFPAIDIQNHLLSLVGGNMEIAQRLLDIAKQDNPNMTEEWYWKKVIFDLESDRI